MDFAFFSLPEEEQSPFGLERWTLLHILRRFRPLVQQDSSLNLVSQWSLPWGKSDEERKVPQLQRWRLAHWSRVRAVDQNAPVHWCRQRFLEHGRVSFITWLRGFRKLFCPGQILTVTSRVTRCKSQLFIKFSETQSLVSQYLTPTGVPEMADFTRSSWSILAVERGRAAVFQLCPQTELPWDESVWPPRTRTAPKESREDLVSSYSPHRTHPDSPHTTTWGGGFVQQTDTGLLIYLRA